MENAGNAVIDFGRFCTGFLVVMGIGTLKKARVCPDILDAHALHFRHNGTDKVFTALPALLAHCHLIQVPAMVMSIIGGLLIYATIISFTMFFQEEQDF